MNNDKFKNSIECNVEFADELEIPFTIKNAIFVPDRLTRKRKEYNRAKEKRDWQKIESDENSR